MTDLTDQLIAAHFGDAAVIDGDVVTVTIDRHGTTDWGGTADNIDSAIEDLRLVADLPYSHSTMPAADGGELFLDQATERVSADGVVTVEAYAWAGNWDEDAEAFSDEVTGRRVTLRIVAPVDTDLADHPNPADTAEALAIARVAEIRMVAAEAERQATDRADEAAYLAAVRAERAALNAHSVAYEAYVAFDTADRYDGDLAYHGVRWGVHAYLFTHADGGE